MTLICEECGKIYHLDAQKLKERLKGDEAKTRCRECGHVMRISRAELMTAAENASRNEAAPLEFPDPAPTVAEAVVADTTVPDASGVADIAAGAIQVKGFGLRSKMFFLFLLIPILLMSASGFFSQNQLNLLANRITEESSDVVRDLAEEIIAEKARAVALQSKIYLLSHPELGKFDFNYDPVFSRIAIQRVGTSGYTLLFERPGPDDDDQALRIWCHPDARLVGKPVLGSIKTALGSHFPEFARIFNNVKRGKESKGYYTWKERDGRLRQKFMVCSPVEGTRYYIIGTAYIEDFTGRIQTLENNARDMTLQTRNITLGILVASLFIIGFSISVYGYRITKNIKHLTHAADRISVGELDTVIAVSSKDEIGNLAEAISRMQDSLRLSIERLRRRR